MRKRTKRVVIAGVVILISVTALIMGRSYIFNRIKTAIEQKLQSLNKSGYNVTYDSVHIDWKKNVIEIGGLVIQKNAYDTTCVQPEFISASKVVAEGFSLTSIIFSRTVDIKVLQLYNPHFVIRQHSDFLSDSAAHRENELSIEVDETRLRSAKFEYLDSASCRRIADVSSNITISSLMIDLHPGNPVDFTIGAVRLDSSRVDLPEKFYTILAEETNIDFSRGMVNVDTVRINPYYEKLTFARKSKYETDRIEGVIPFLNLSGFSMKFGDTVAVTATQANIQLYMRVFRDKRMPFKATYKPLPGEMLRNLAFGLSIDTLTVTKSFIEYEEFAEGTDSSGNVHFDNLEAVIYNISNDVHLKADKTIMHARAALMGQGDLSVNSEYSRTSKKCLINGSLKEMEISEVNSMMVPVTNMKAESGDLESLTFKFIYDNTGSEGELELNYTNLKLVSYKDDEKLKKQVTKRKNNGKKKPGKIDNLKTLILNAFVIRKNMDEKVPEGKRSGTILFYRDTTRSVFNFWWKSLLSGLRSAFHLDKYNERDNKKNRKKTVNK